LINYHNIFVDIIQRWLFKVELLLLIFAGVLSYFLSGLSMRPIEEKNKKTRRFLADVSHELKNPLSALKISLDVSKRQKDWRVGEVQEVFTDLESEVSRLIKITDDLLTLEATGGKRNFEYLNLKDVTNFVLKQLGAYAKKKNIQVSSDLADFYFKILRKDFEKLIFNIVHNAIKFSKQNSVIEIKLFSNGELRIKDYGIGIGKNELKHIFDRFYKIDSARTITENNGSGLGLSIVKDICETYDINIYVDSVVGKFTEFILTFQK
jgi:two-component system phosphate regulon sensor histidine kinase PhoR